MTSRPRARRLALAAVLTAVVVAMFAGTAGAHAIVRETEPTIGATVDAPPDRIVMRFNESVEIAFGAIRAFDANGRRVDVGDADHLPGEPDAVQVLLAPDLADGTYTVAWRVVSADGHPVAEAFVFHVGAPGAQPQGLVAEFLAGANTRPVEAVLFGITRVALFAGLVLLVGAAVFLVVVWRPGLVRHPEVEELFGARWRRVAATGWWVTVTATIVSVVLQGSVAGDFSLWDAASLDVVGRVLGTRFGRMALIRLVLLVAIGAVAVGWWRNRSQAHAEPRVATAVGAAAVSTPIPRTIVVGGGLALAGIAATPGLAGHAGATAPVVVNVLTDTLHVLAAGAWLGGLVLLLRGAFGGSRSLAAADRLALLAPVVRRFSLLASGCVALLVATGAWRSWVEVHALRPLFSTSYGWTLVAKLAVFGVLLALGGLNQFRLRPRIEGDDVAAGTTGLALLRRSVALEVALGAIVLALTAVLVNLAPARVEAGLVGPAVIDTTLGELRLEVLVDPNRVGENFVHLTATTADGAPAAEIEAMSVNFRMPERDIGPLLAEGLELAPGHFVVQGRELAVPGRWQLEVVATVGRFDDLRATVDVVVNG